MNNEIPNNIEGRDIIMKDLDDKRLTSGDFGEMDKTIWYLSRKNTAEYLLDKYSIIRRKEVDKSPLPIELSTENLRRINSINPITKQ